VSENQDKIREMIAREDWKSNDDDDNVFTIDVPEIIIEQQPTEESTQVAEPQPQTEDKVDEQP